MAIPMIIGYMRCRVQEGFAMEFNEDGCADLGDAIRRLCPEEHRDQRVVGIETGHVRPDVVGEGRWKDKWVTDHGFAATRLARHGGRGLKPWSVPYYAMVATGVAACFDVVVPQYNWGQLARIKVLLANGTSNNWQGPPCSLELDSKILHAARLAPR